MIFFPLVGSKYMLWSLHLLFFIEIVLSTFNIGLDGVQPAASILLALGILSSATSVGLACAELTAVTDRGWASQSQPARVHPAPESADRGPSARRSG